MLVGAALGCTPSPRLTGADLSPFGFDPYPASEQREMARVRQLRAQQREQLLQAPGVVEVQAGYTLMIVSTTTPALVPLDLDGTPIQTLRVPSTP